ncbi:MAG TPA: heme-binding protein [Candidatus Scatomonas pullistercoris]|uniref:Heme-binding protein n=1 Tax=Candidatus Scatomonas pullistercoris TaxID=2840920 RepID=A0A9D1P1B5_9FIRM|nr:heme-binding protein [Candidatus Scatomonas pullistercoris]
MTIEELLKVLEMQEEILQFSHFTHGDAWELGTMIVMEARRRNTPVALKIQMNSGQTIFQYEFDGVTPYTDELADRKLRVVKQMETSSLHLHMLLRQNEESLADMGLDPALYANCGGGFPIRVEDVGVVGAVSVAGVNHVADHDLVVKCISKYLHIDEVPRIRAV